MPRVPLIRLRFSDETSMDLPEHEVVQVVGGDLSDQPGEGLQKIDGGDATKYAKLAKVRAAALTRGQRMVTFRGILTIENAKRA